jgi:hypothetical protein
MDPLSIATSVVGLGKLVQATVICLKTLAQDYKGFSKEIQILGTELRSLSLVINSLEKYIEGDSTLASILPGAVEDKHLISALNACHPTLKAIKAKCEQVRQSASQGSINKIVVGVF